MHCIKSQTDDAPRECTARRRFLSPITNSETTIGAGRIGWVAQIESPRAQLLFMNTYLGLRSIFETYLLIHSCKGVSRRVHQTHLATRCQRALLPKEDRRKQTGPKEAVWEQRRWRYGMVCMRNGLCQPVESTRHCRVESVLSLVSPPDLASTFNTAQDESS